MSIQWVSSFEDLRGGSGGTDIANMLEWSSIGDFTNIEIAAGSNDSNLNKNGTQPTLNGSAAALLADDGPSSGSYGQSQAYARSMADNAKVVVAGGVQVPVMPLAKQNCILAMDGDNKLALGLNGKFAAIYINDVLAATSSFDATTGAPWFFAELFQDRSLGKVFLKINGQAAADADLPVGHALVDTAIMELGIQAAVRVSEVIVYDSIDPMGPLMVHEFFKTSNTTQEFTGSDVVNSRPFSSGVYRSSEIAGAVDLYSYNNILPADVQVSEIKAVIHKAVAASGGVSGGTLNLRLQLGGVDYDTSVSSKLVSTSPVLVQKVWDTNPATSAAWTRSEVQAIKTGYVVAA